MAASIKPMRGQVIDPLFDDFNWDHDEAAVLEIQLQVKRLSAVEAWLHRKRRLQQIKRELEAQKWWVRGIIGKHILPKKTSDPDVNSKIKNV